MLLIFLGTHIDIILQESFVNMPAVLFAHRVCICILKHKQKYFWDVKIITGLCEHIL